MISFCYRNCYRNSETARFSEKPRETPIIRKRRKTWVFEAIRDEREQAG